MSPAPSLAEHLFVLFFTVVYPVAGYMSFQRLKKRIAEGYPADRPKLYRHTVTGHSLLLVAGLYLWFSAGRSPAGIGLSIDLNAGFLVSVPFVVTGIALLVGQLRQARRGDRELLDAMDASFGSIRHLLPRTRHELRGFYRVGASAGIVEEILWRGYLLAYLETFLPMGVAAAVVIAVFGLAHAYQGIASIPRITLAGAAFTGLYLLSGSIWLPVALHAAVDMLQGRMAYEVITRRRLYA